ncbi:U7 snRNA-associated Sm-like protein LSm10 isoform X2 [Macrobrachium nipponense]|uniref:U7 snRNA-associated Sm-like protein LSm10 isoform X2 n=1 Tax=Macrobrachium nipponense TaxID=159736 RepID=UPI0030C85ECF
MTRVLLLLNMGLHAREIQHQYNTLACLLMGLEGWKTTVELHNDAFVTGLIVEVDAKMNMEMQGARYTDGNGKSVLLDNFHVRGRKIRYVHIPDQVDVTKLISEKVTPRDSKRKMTKKGLIAQKRTEQTLRRYRRQQEAQVEAGSISAESPQPSTSKD